MMEKIDILFRKAFASDAGFISKAVLAAVGAGDFEKDSDDKKALALSVVNDIVLMEDTLYSFRNVLVAEVGGTCAGCSIAYNGDRYKALRDKTFNIVKERLGLDLSGSEDETGPGEYYLDSLAVDPSFRRNGIGRQLVYQTLETGAALGFDKASLLVLASDNRLRALYSSCGFKADGHRKCFGADYLRMVAVLH